MITNVILYNSSINKKLILRDLCFRHHIYCFCFIFNDKFTCPKDNYMRMLNVKPFIYIYIDIYIYIYTPHTHIYIYTHTHTIYIYIYTHTHTHTHTYIYIYYTHTHTYIYIYIYTHTHIYIYIYIYIYTIGQKFRTVRFFIFKSLLFTKPAFI